MVVSRFAETLLECILLLFNVEDEQSMTINAYKLIIEKVIQNDNIHTYRYIHH